MNQIKCYICDQLVICNSIKAIHFATKSDTIHKSNNYQIFLYNLRHPLIPNKVAVKAAHNSHSILPVEHQQGHTTVQPLHWGLYTGLKAAVVTLYIPVVNDIQRHMYGDGWKLDENASC